MGFGICDTSQVMVYVAVRPVETLLLEFLDYHSALYPEGVLAEGRREHPVALEVQGSVEILCRKSVVEICEVVACPRVAASSGSLKFSVEIGNVRRTGKHEVLEKMRDARQGTIFVARSYII